MQAKLDGLKHKKKKAKKSREHSSDASDSSTDGQALRRVTFGRSVTAAVAGRGGQSRQVAEEDGAGL